MRNYIMLY